MMLINLGVNNFGDMDEEEEQYQNDADNAANVINNWWRQRTQDFWDAKDRKKIKIDFGHKSDNRASYPVPSNNHNNDLACNQFVAGADKYAMDLDSNDNLTYSHNNDIFGSSGANDNNSDINTDNLTNEDKSKLNIWKNYPVNHTVLPKNTPEKPQEKSNEIIPLENPQSYLTKKRPDKFNRQDCNSAPICEIKLSFPIKLLAFLHNRKDSNPNEDIHDLFDFSLCDKTVNVQVFIFPGLKNISEKNFSDFKKRLYGLHPKCKVNELQRIDYESCLKIIIQVRLYITMKISDHNIIMVKCKQKIEEMADSAEYNKQFDKSNAENMFFNSNLSFKNKISKKCVEHFNQLGNGISEQEITYLQNQN